MNKELLFAQTLEKVKEIARAQGNCISEEDVKEEFMFFLTEMDKLNANETINSLQ